VAKYELMVVLDPFIEEAEVTAELDKAQEQIKRRGGTLTNVDNWGKRRLAYPINKKLEGTYALLSFDATSEGAQLAELERTLRLDEKVMRVMLTRIPDPKKPRKVKVKKPKPAGQAATEVQYGNAGRGYSERDPMASGRNQ
jgi:small subunit ribosomal protein S6